MWWHMRRNQISSFDETDESILNRRGRQFSRLLAAEVCASAVVMLDTPCYEVVWRVLATHSIRQFPLHFPSRASSCAITFQLDFTSIPSLTYKTISYTLALGLLFSTLRSSGAAMEDAVSQNQHATTYNVITAISGHQQSASLAYTPITTS